VGEGVMFCPYLIKMWLQCPVEETDDRGRRTRTTEARDNRRGIPQGSAWRTGRGRHKDRAPGEPLLQEISRHAHRIRTAGHAGFPWTLRGLRPVSDHAALICWQTPPPCLAWVLDPTVRSNLAWLR
jgi:hypothetical protein